VIAKGLKDKGIKGIEVSGTVGPSITGWDAKRAVVLDDEDALSVLKTIEATLAIVHAGRLTEAIASAEKWKESLSSAEIAKLASEVAAKTKPIFEDFLKVLSNGRFSGILNTKNYKEYFATAD
jgi:hypothetical protein